LPLGAAAAGSSRIFQILLASAAAHRRWPELKRRRHAASRNAAAVRLETVREQKLRPTRRETR
jgi:hypothetical protein